jgi:UDP-N-acetylmuramyl pentapeptide synthase
VAIIKLFRPYPKYLVLEYGIDHPGEMDFLISIAQPNIAIITPVESNHLEQFGSLELYRKNKLQLIAAAKYAILHESLRQYVDTDALYYSLGALSDIDASNINISIS